MWAMKSDIVCFENLPKGAWVQVSNPITTEQEARISADSSIPGTHSVISKIYISEFGPLNRGTLGFKRTCPHEDPLKRDRACQDGDTLSVQGLGSIWPVRSATVNGLDAAIFGADSITLDPPNGVWGGDCFRFGAEGEQEITLVPIANYTSADVDLDWNGETFIGLGLENLNFDGVKETEDIRGGAVNIRLPAEHRGVTVDLFAESNRLRGAQCKVWGVHFDPGTGTMLGEPLLLFMGFCQAGYEVTESRGEDGSASAEIVIRVASRLADLDRSSGIRANMTSHQVYYPGDTFFEGREKLIGSEIPWGVPSEQAGEQP